MSRPVWKIGDPVRGDGREWSVAGVEAHDAEGPRIWLVERGRSSGLAVFGLAALSDLGFELLKGPPRLRVPQMGLLSTVSEDQQVRAFALEQHVREVETGFPTPALGRAERPRPQYDPALTTLAQREQAKADELAEQGWTAVSRATVRRWRKRYREGGVGPRFEAGRLVAVAAGRLPGGRGVAGLAGSGGPAFPVAWVEEADAP